MSRGIWLLVACLVLAPQRLYAGVYNSNEPLHGPAGNKGPIEPLPFPLFKTQLTDLLNVRFPIETVVRKRYLEKRTELEAKLRAGNATPEDQLSLSAYLMYFGDAGKAIEILTPLAARDRGNYLVNANLMTAYQLASQLDRAASIVPQLRGGKPQFPGATKEQLEWLSRVESFHQKLVNDRYRESLRSRTGRPEPPETVDDLFGVRFVGPSGNYEAGTLAAEEKAKLPPDALAIVQQLLIWMPEDTRLYWLLGELYNAQGDIARAAAVFDDCRRESTRRLDAAALREHRQIVQEAVANAPPPSNDLAESLDPVGTTDTSADWLPDLRKLIIVGGIAGVAILAFVYFQVREFRRRRGGRSTGCCG
jgi:hypothetical protein